MSEDNTAESLQKLNDLSNRIDERVKGVQDQQKNLEKKIESIQCEHATILQRIAVLESVETIQNCKELEKRLVCVEASTSQSRDRWNRIFTFIIQIIWVILAAWLLMKLGLQAPAVP